MTRNFVHIVLVGAAYALLFQVHRVSTIDCGMVNFVRPAILGGSETVKGEWPFIVAIHKHTNYICGGTIISIRHILTAAHCIQKKDSETELSPNEIVVRLGAYNLTNANEKGVIQRNVSQICIHPDWDPFARRFDADIAILVLSENITFTNDIQPVCMPAEGVVTEDMEGSVVGYGVRRRRIYVEVPRRIIVKAVNNSHCFREDDGAALYSSGRTFCGGNGDGSPELGESGGGYFFTPGFSWAQYGIVAAIRTNDTGEVIEHAYHIYTNVTMFKDWIIETVNQTGGVVGEARANVIMNCVYDYRQLAPLETIYSCGLFNIDIQGNNFETGSFVGTHLQNQKQSDVEGIAFTNGTMSYLPSGFGLVFVNIKHLVVGDLMTDSATLGTKVVRRSDLRNLRQLSALSFYRNDIETLHEDALWDLPNLQFIVLIENKLKVLFNETFSRNRMLMKVIFRSNELTFLPANLFRNNRLLMLVNFRNNFLQVIDENFFKTSRRLISADFGRNQLRTLPRHLFQHKLSLELVVLDNNALSSIDEDLFETNSMLQGTKFGYNRIETLPPTLFRNNLRLYAVEFQNNSIAAVDDALFINNRLLKIVSFADNRLRHLQRDVFKSNPLLTELILFNNPLKSIDVDFAEFNQISHIDLRQNDCINEMYAEQNSVTFRIDNLVENLVEFQNHVKANCSTGV